MIVATIFLLIGAITSGALAVDDEVVTLQPPEEGSTRGLFSWGQEDNSTDEALGDEAQNDEQRQRATGAVFYLRRSPQKKVLFPRQAVAQQNDKGDDYLRRMYYHNNYYYNQLQQPYYNQQQPYYYYYYQRQHPGLSESQIAWIHSLPPELRDQYLRDYAPYNHLYLRQPLESLSMSEAPLDYSCNRAGSPFVAAPRIARARVLRYDRRTGASGQPYLAAVYRCASGHSLHTPAHSELYCSAGRWVGPRPICLPYQP